jgi:hypothetical protein
MNLLSDFPNFFKPESLMQCQHCRKAPASRPRQLCWVCYYAPGVRGLYPSTSKFARRGLGNFFARSPLPAFPTSAAPGSPEKIAVMQERARLKQSLWHPEDATGIYTPVLAQAG